MKKLFTLALVLLVATAGYSQVRKVSRNDALRQMTTMQTANGMEVSNFIQSEPNMTRSDGELDFSTYDWQTNHGAINRTIMWPDGKVNFAYTIATDASYTTRGTGIGTYDSENDEWIPSGGRIESEKTGFGSIARYKENGIVVAAHTATDTKIYIVEDKDDMAPNSVSAVLNIGTDMYTHPCVMTSGPNREIIHMVCSEFNDGDPDGNGIEHGIRYYRSSNGIDWDINCMELPFLTIEYGTEHGGNTYYWMETTEDNCLALVINSGNVDGMVIYSYDDGETWERKVYFHDPAPGVALENSFAYPRWTSAQWNSNMELMLAYEFNFSDHQGHYGPSTGGVAFWSEYMPYHGESLPVNGVDPTNPMPPTPGQPFIMDSAYLFQDIYASAWFWSDQSHEMWPEYFGYLPALTDEGYWEDPETATSWNITLSSDMHGSYNSGVCAFPVLCKVGDSDLDLVAVWSACDENSQLPEGTYFYKLFAAYSGDGGLTWQHQEQLTTDFMWEMSECVYPQAAVIGTTLVVAAQLDGEIGSSVMGDDADPDNNYYQGFTFDLNDLFPGVGLPEEVNQNTHMSVYPNPATDQIGITLSKNADIVIYNIMGQVVMTAEGHAGANTLNISNLTSGIYFVNAGSDTQKFIVK